MLLRQIVFAQVQSLSVQLKHAFVKWPILYWNCEIQG